MCCRCLEGTECDSNEGKELIVEADGAKENR
jgi:hypothetical protein